MITRIKLIIALFCTGISIRSYAGTVNYSECRSLQDVIARETQEIINLDQDDYHELAELHVSRGESYLLAAQYEQAIDDFQKATSYLEDTSNLNPTIFTIFRAVFGKIICYDNLDMDEQVQENLEQLQEISSHINCDNYIENPLRKSLIKCPDFHNRNRWASGSTGFHRGHFSHAQENQDSYADVLGPDKAPSLGWCEEVVVGV